MTKTLDLRIEGEGRPPHDRIPTRGVGAMTFGGVEPPYQAATVGRLTVAVSLMALMVSSVM